jgi:predicted DNA-binding antitoxin AbrB/MazE fold protein
MSEIITAVYKKGTLRPTRPLNLHENQMVRIQVLPDEPADKTEEIITAMIAVGLLTPPPGHTEVAPISSEERLRLAKMLSEAPGKSLSEIIIEERGEW